MVQEREPTNDPDEVTRVAEMMRTMTCECGLPLLRDKVEKDSVTFSCENNHYIEVLT